MAKAIEVHQSLVRTKVQGLIRTFVPEPPIPKIDVAVSAGLHADFTCSLACHTFSIGSSVDCDLVLLDDNIAEQHATISISPSLFGCAVQVHTMQSDVNIDGKPVQPNTPSSFDTLPAKLNLGSVAIDFASHGKAKPDKGINLYDLTLRSSVIALLFFLVLISLDFASQATADAVKSSQTDQSSAATLAETGDTMPIPIILADKIAEAGLTGDLEISEQANTIVVTGSLTDAQMNRWQSIHQWFDSQPNVGLLSANVRTAPVLDKFPAVASVRLGATPQIRLLDGEIIRVGDIVHEGWKVIAITAEGLDLENGAENAKIAF